MESFRSNLRYLIISEVSQELKLPAVDARRIKNFLVPKKFQGGVLENPDCGEDVKTALHENCSDLD